jgi:hypothetical protein
MAFVSPRRRPLSVALYFACHATAAALLALPTTAVVAGTGVGRFAEGDRSLFEPGGVVAAEVARALAPSLPAQLGSSLATATVLGVLLLVPHAALLVGLSRTERESPAATWGRAVGVFPSFVALSGFTLLAQVILGFATLTLASGLRDAVAGAVSRTADLAYVAALAFGSLGVLAVGLVRDLGRAAIVCGAADAKAGLFTGLRAFGASPLRSAGRYLVPALVGVALVALGAALTAAIDVSRPGSWRVGLVAVVHQLVAFALCFCRAYWLSASLGLVAAVPRVAPGVSPVY